MRILNLSEIRPGKAVWLESYGFAFKTLSLSRATVLAVTSSASYFAFPFCKMECSYYNAGLTWRCWDEQPDLDTLADKEWLCTAG